MLLWKTLLMYFDTLKVDFLATYTIYFSPLFKHIDILSLYRKFETLLCTLQACRHSAKACFKA